MVGLALTLPLGVVLLVLGFVALYRLTPLNGKQAAALAALLAIVLYLPYALLQWPGADVVAMHVAVFLVAAYVLGIIFGRHTPGAGGKWFHWGPALIIAFFLVILAMDSVFVTLSLEGLPKPLQEALLPSSRSPGSANTAFPGVVHRNYYKQEQNYNQHLEQLEAQQALGWQVKKGWLTERPEAGRNAVLQVAVTARDGAPLAGAEVVGRFMRASDSRFDRPFSMEEVSPGLYRASLALPLPGAWQLDLRIRHDGLAHESRSSTTIYETSTTP